MNIGTEMSRIKNNKLNLCSNLSVILMNLNISKAIGWPLFCWWIDDEL